MTDQVSNNNPFAIYSAMGSMIGYVLINLALVLLATNMLSCVVYSYVKMYVRYGKDEFTTNDVWSESMKNFGPFLIATIVTVAIMCVGFVFCIIPGIYLAIALSLILAIMIFEEEGISVAFNRSFKLIKTKWWFTFGVFIVAGIIIYILSILISIPSMAMGLKSMFFNLKQTHNPAMNFSVGFYVVSSITNLISQFFTVIPLIITCFLYFSFVEEKEKPSLLEKIDQINANE